MDSIDGEWQRNNVALPRNTRPKSKLQPRPSRPRGDQITSTGQDLHPGLLSPAVTQRVAVPAPSLNGDQNSAGATSLKARYVAAGTVGTESTVNSGPKRLPRMSRPPDLERLESGRR